MSDTASQPPLWRVPDATTLVIERGTRDRVCTTTDGRADSNAAWAGCCVLGVIPPPLSAGPDIGPPLSAGPDIGAEA